MKRISIILLIFMVTVFVSCSSSDTEGSKVEDTSLPYNEVTTTAKTQTEPTTDNKISSKDTIMNDEYMWQYIQSNYPEFSLDDYKVWHKTSLDITGNGQDEVIFSSSYGEGKLAGAIVLMLEDGVIREISTYIPLAKYGNMFYIKDGFLVHEAKSGGTGLSDLYMSLYYYTGYYLEEMAADILLTSEVSFYEDTYNIKSEIQGTLLDFVITYYKETADKSDVEIIAKDRYTFDADRYDIWHTPVSIANTSDPFDQIYNGENFYYTLMYFYNNLYSFGEKERKAFSAKIMETIHNDASLFLNPHGGFLEGYEHFYDINTNSFNVKELDDFYKELIEKIEKRDIYDISKLFYTTEGSIEDYGFGITLRPWPFMIIKIAYNDVVERFSTCDFQELPFFAPRIYYDEWTPIQAVTKSRIIYPNIYVNNIQDVYAIEGQDTWKSMIILPMALFDGDETNNRHETSEFTNKVNFPKVDNIWGEDINYGDYYTVIVPMYNGIYEKSGDLENIEFVISHQDKKAHVQFAVFGEFNIGGFSVFSSVDSEGVFHYIGQTLSNCIVNVYCDLPTDFSYVKVTGSVFFNGENYSVELILDDMRDHSEYEILRFN